jgi:hypothetical protein
MKRTILILIACAVVFVATRRIVQFFGENASTLASKTPSSDLQQTLTRPIQPQPLITSLPPLTNLVLRTSQPSTPPRIRHAQQEIQPAKSPAPSPAPQQRTGKAPRQDPMARVALSLVGVDPSAEEYWAMAINDPSLSDNEREDLIEDLNEEGFEDPKNPTLDELPLIINRLQIIEDYAPSAMDEVNARSFAEAYKDLFNMYVRLTGQPAQ